MKDPLKDYREIHRALEPMREIQRALEPMRQLREALDTMRIRDPLADTRQALQQLQMRDALAEHRKALEILRLHDPLAETRKLLENLKFIDPLQHTRELLQALSSSADLYRSIYRHSISATGVATAVANVEAQAEIEVTTAETEDILDAISRRLHEVRAAASIGLLDRLSLEFYLNLIFAILLLLYQLHLSNESEQRITSEIVSFREQILERFEDETAHHADPSTYYLVRRATLLLQSPKRGAKPLGVLYPNQLTRLVERKGKWIRVEHFDHLTGIHRSGWCLKKYLDRIPPGSLDSRGRVLKPVGDSAKLPVDGEPTESLTPDVRSLVGVGAGGADRDTYRKHLLEKYGR